MNFALAVPHSETQTGNKFDSVYCKDIMFCNKSLDKHLLSFKAIPAFEE